jgi:ATP-binding cassette subfamily C (CFTR/MRP) protein 10
LIDDPFASLDRKVGRYVWKNAIEGLLRDKGRLVVVATHNSEFLRQTDLLVQLDHNGNVRSIDKPSEFFKNKREFGEVDELSEIPDNAVEPSVVSEASSSFPPFDNVEHVQKFAEDEHMENGTVKVDIYWSYLRAVGFGLAALIGVSLLAMQTSKNLSDAWLSKWTLNSTGNETVGQLLTGSRHVVEFGDAADLANTRYYLTVFVCIAGANTIFTLLRAFLFAYGGVVAAKNLHESLLSRVLTVSPLSLFINSDNFLVIYRFLGVNSVWACYQPIMFRCLYG